MQISCGDIRANMKLEVDGDVWTVISAEHYKRENRRAIIRTRLKSVSTGRVMEKNFRANDYVEQADVELRDMQYLYREGDMFVFMDNVTFDQIHLSADLIGEGAGFLKEGTTVKVSMHKGRAIGVELPPKVDLKIVQTAPAVRGDTVQNATKAATLETGLVIQVPLFVNEGEVVRVSTRDGSYVERV